jgi:pentatricopeptide repeat protein
MHMDVLAYTMVMKAYNNCKQWQQAVAVYEQLEHDSEVQADKHAYAAAARAYKELGDANRVSQMKAKMAASGSLKQ